MHPSETRAETKGIAVTTSLSLSQLPNPLLQELLPWFLLRQGQRLLIRTPASAILPSLQGQSMLYPSPARFLPSIITLLNIRLIRV